MYNCDPSDCWDDDIQTGNCAQLAAAGQCKSNVAEMMVRCKKSCNFCSGLITDGTPSTITNVVTSSTQSTESAVHSSTQTETEMTASTSRSSTVQSTTNRPSSVDCSTKPDGNYADTINPCSGSFVTCSNGRSYRMVKRLNKECSYEDIRLIIKWSFICRNAIPKDWFLTLKKTCAIIPRMSIRVMEAVNSHIITSCVLFLSKLFNNS